MQASALPFEPAAALPAEARSTPLWPCSLQILGATSICLGILWDISWHETIGRDTFWTPAHMAIYLGGLLGGGVSAWLIYQATFVASSPFGAASVRILGLRGPIGAWITLWGAAAMMVSAPFDDWWHNTYGLDVKILSPPHSVLAAGMHHVVVGAVLLVLAFQNRAVTRQDGAGRLLFVYASGIMLTLASVIITEHSFPNQQHSGPFYVACGIVYPSILVAVARAAKIAWPATLIAAVYTLFYLLLIWILPLFPAHPQLAPIYNPVTHMVPPPFPVWLIVPAAAMDCLLRWVGRPNRWFTDWLVSPLLAAVFIGLLWAVQWNFAKFMLTPAAENWLFAGQAHWPYWVRPGSWQTRFPTHDTLTPTWLLIAGIAATLSTRVGLIWGNWMATVKR